MMPPTGKQVKDLHAETTSQRDRTALLLPVRAPARPRLAFIRRDSLRAFTREGCGGSEIVGGQGRAVAARRIWLDAVRLADRAAPCYSRSFCSPARASLRGAWCLTRGGAVR